VTSPLRLAARRLRASGTRRATRAVANARAGLDRLLVRPESERALRRDLRREGAADRPASLGPIWRDWVNRALRSEAEVEAAITEIRRCGLPAHGERTKNWDLAVALGEILDRVPRDGPVLDMGAPLYSRLLPWLYLCGYRSLQGIDLTFERPIRRGPIRYERMDMTRTTFPDGSFAAIASLSVIEHGVDLEAYLDEAARLLRPGGLLITSTDFWCEPVDTGGQEAYGVPIRIFRPADLERFVASAASRGLRPVRPLDLACDERVVTWRRFDLRYTFVNVVLERAGSESASSA
jgi:SAM-dependent methyltransferase